MVLRSLALWRDKEQANRDAARDLLQEYGKKSAVPVGFNPRSQEPAWAEYENIGTFLAMLLARRGSGKSVFLAWLAWWFRLTRDTATLYFDPGDELQFHRQALSKPSAAVAALEKMGFSPCGLNGNLQRLRPAATEGDCDKPFSFSFADLRAFGKQKHETLLSAALGCKPDSHAQIRMVAQMADFKDFETSLDLLVAYKHLKHQMSDEGEASSAARILQNINILADRKVLEGPVFDFKSALNARQVLAILGSQAGTSETALLHAFHSTYLATALFEWRKAGAVPETFVAREEASYALSTFEGQVIVDHEISKERKSGNHFAYVLQNLGQIPDSVLYQMLDSCVVFGTKMPRQQLERIAAAKMLDEYQLDRIAALDSERRPGEWWVVDATGKLQTFEPFTPPSQFHVM